MIFSLDQSIIIVIHQTDLTLTSYIKNQLAPFNLAPEQTLIMMVLWEKDGFTQIEIAEKLLKDKTNIARMALNLEQKGFIRRISPENDRRSLLVYLTEEGKQLRHEIISMAEKINDLIIKGISDDELNEMKRILSKICSNSK
ncbi:MarR family winged helix-turn-helix transcriptional regulator [Paenibacillus solisilvae]|uniref:MarR family winged helix-turn-helix transcriptional regulator n=1 Tax=Paenibacillus solisilvae TaxID=2486751 RepID=A0ABW0W030_9BACL